MLRKRDIAAAWVFALVAELLGGWLVHLLIMWAWPPGL